MTEVTLDIYVDDQCGGCETAESLAGEVREWFPALRVILHRLAPGQPLPAGVVAVPAYLLEGDLIQYGTPERQQIGRAVLDALATRLAESQG
ncbi:MAG: hypothetical protein V3V06_05950 [Dehalococcoidia bacterium]